MTRWSGGRLLEAGRAAPSSCRTTTRARWYPVADTNRTIELVWSRKIRRAWISERGGDRISTWSESGLDPFLGKQKGGLEHEMLEVRHRYSAYGLRRSRMMPAITRPSPTRPRTARKTSSGLCHVWGSKELAARPNPSNTARIRTPTNKRRGDRCGPAQLMCTFWH
jgi:hypothetical protein